MFKRENDFGSQNAKSTALSFLQAVQEIFRVTMTTEPG
jgi:hypothetical protein